MEIIIALDIGLKRTGIARSDIMGIIIKPVTTIATEEIIQYIKDLEKEYTLQKIIVGSPQHKPDKKNIALEIVNKVLGTLQTAFPEKEFISINEKLTSKEAESILKEKKIRIDKSNKELLDMYSAALLLEDFFNQIT